jgi:hypothetical protein
MHALALAVALASTIGVPVPGHVSSIRPEATLSNGGRVRIHDSAGAAPVGRAES